MRKSDIEELFEEINSNLSIVENKYRNAYSDNQIKELVRVKVKSILEHLRSCLDYLAHDIYEKVYLNTDIKNQDSSNLKIYFPYGKTNNSFEKNLSRNFTDLKIKNSEIYSLIASVQLFSCGNDWLYNLCNLTNNNKHNALTKQKRSDFLKVSLEGINIFRVDKNLDLKIEMRNNTINGIMQNKNITIDIDNGKVEENFDGLNWNADLIAWTSFTFYNTNIEVTELLKTSFKNLKQLVENIYKTF